MIDKRMLYSQGQRVTKSLDGSRPGYRGSDYGDQTYSRGAYSSPSSSKSYSKSYNPGAGGVVDHTPQNTGSRSNEDRSSALQTYNHNIATGQGDKNPIGPVQLNEREQAFQNFLDYRKPVKLYGLSKLFEGPAQVFSDWSASKNRPHFEKVIRAGRIPGLSFGMTQQQFEDAYQSYMANRLSGKTDAYGNPMQGFQYGDDNVLTGRFDNSKGDGIMSVDVDETTDDTTDDTTTDNELILRFLGADSTLDPAAAGLASTEELRNMLLERAKNLYKT